MGIKFECPNGHRLHVKSFLAGKRAKCPHCNAKVMVPAPAEMRPAAPDPGFLPPPSPPTPPPLPLPSHPATFREPPAFASPPTQPDEPGWFVRPPGGGQFGPAPTELFEQWRHEGRVPDEALVWQEGWPEWRRAADVEDLDEPLTVATIEEEPSQNREPSTSVLRHPRKKDHTVLAIALLSAASLILLVILLWVLNRTG